MFSTYMPTEIGIISDVHADLDGLNRALDIFKNLGTDQVICAGDLVDIGEDNEAVIQRIITEKIDTVQGNHDWMARMNQTRLNQNQEDDSYISDIFSLSHNELTFLDTLPRTLRYEIEGYTVVVAHGSLSNLTQRITPNLDEDVYRDLLWQAQADVLILGHTHIPMVVRVESKGIIINPGSTYRNKANSKSYSTCAILELPRHSVTHYSLITGKPVDVARRVLR